MYARASTGGNFGNAARYNEEGLSAKQKEQKLGKVAFLGSSNLLSDDATGIAAEMAAVASRSRSEKPVWNVSLSVEPGQQLTDDQWRKAVEIYMKEMGADPARHQVAIWRHSDTKHDHVHALINAVPIDRGPALLRYHNNKKAVGVAVKIDQALGLTPPKQRTSLRSHSPKTQQARQTVASALNTVLHSQKPTNFTELTADLQQLGITTKVNLASKGISFKSVDSEPVKGSSVGFKFAQINTILEANRAEYVAEIKRLEQEKADAAKESQAETERLKSELSEAYDKRDALRDAFLNQAPEIKPDPADKAKIEELAHKIEQLRQDKSRAETAFNNLKNQPAAERIVPDPKDKQKIKELEGQNEILRQKLETATKLQELILTKRGIEINTAQAVRLLDGKPLVLSPLKLILEIVDSKLVYRSIVDKGLNTPTSSKPIPPIAIGPTSIPTLSTLNVAGTASEAPKKTLSERFNALYGSTPNPSAIARLEAGERLNFGKLGKTVWLENGKLKSVPYQAKPVAVVESSFVQQLRADLQRVTKPMQLKGKGYTVSTYMNGSTVDYVIGRPGSQETVKLSELKLSQSRKQGPSQKQ